MKTNTKRKMEHRKFHIAIPYYFFLFLGTKLRPLIRRPYSIKIFTDIMKDLLIQVDLVYYNIFSSNQLKHYNYFQSY